MCCGSRDRKTFQQPVLPHTHTRARPCWKHITHACTRSRKLICSTSLACIVARGCNMLKGEMGPSWIAHQSAERRRGKRRTRGEGREWSRWLGTCSTHRESLALLFFVSFAYCTFSTCSPSCLAVFLQLCLLSLTPINTHKRPSPCTAALSSRAVVHLQPHICAHGGSVSRGGKCRWVHPNRALSTRRHPYQLLLVSDRHVHLLALYFLLHTSTLMISLGCPLLSSALI